MFDVNYIIFFLFQKDKLTFDAVPTLNGPYCDPSKSTSTDTSQEFLIPILVEDIENDVDKINDKRYNFSVKYGDFLTNNEFADSSARYNRNFINLIKENSDINIINSSHNNKTKEKMLSEPQKKKLPLPAKKVKTLLPQPVLVPPYSDLSNELKMGKELNLEQNVVNLNSNLNQPSNYIMPEISVPTIQADNVANPVVIKIQPKVNIITEEKIEDLMDIAHIKITGKFEPVSPSKPLYLPDKKKVLHKDDNKPVITPHKKNISEEVVKDPIKPSTTISEKLKVLNDVNVDLKPEISKIQKVQQDENKATTTQTPVTEKLPQTPVKKSVQVKNKVTPERIAAIEKKRQFNMKLKDIIESCLDKLDDPVNNYETTISDLNKIEKPIDEINKVNKPLKQINTKKPEEKVVSLIKKENGLSSAHDSTIAYLEERMKQMENTLLNKIAQNSQEIIAFKKSWSKEQVVTNRKEKCNKRCASTQTNENITSHKKFLYQEISKYLSPSANSLIYEELFINKYSCQFKSPRRKRRKCI